MSIRALAAFFATAEPELAWYTWRAKSLSVVARYFALPRPYGLDDTNSDKADYAGLRLYHLYFSCDRHMNVTGDKGWKHNRFAWTRDTLS